MDADHPSDAPLAGETPAQRQARLRRERRQAKIAAGGSDRLKAITNLSGRQHMPVSAEPSSSPSPQPSNSIPAPAPSQPASHAPASDVSFSESAFRQALQQSMMDQQAQQQQQQQRQQPQTPRPDDPLLQLLQQVMGDQMPPGAADPLAELLGARPPAGGAASGPQQASTQGPQRSAREPSVFVWRVVHAVVCVVFALWVVWGGEFDGTKAGREGYGGGGGGSGKGAVEYGQGPVLWFLTLEAVLQGSRFFMEGSGMHGPGLLGTIGAAIPQPWSNYLRILGRYGVIFRSLAEGVKLIVFVLGAVSWWNAAVI